ncbi:hypothetical protein [Xylanibacter muris]|uniref:Outer membrane protein beta-barrel domain-containing protein n=2 Tax=Xylanibacter muris TaxID=2736290 RepID=A0ABX2AQI0_9BACT|nr:hypothetical protein [Xylanibacter muris]NPD92502.1 hypothetical protein [Xylanibacter muris]
MIRKYIIMGLFFVAGGGLAMAGTDMAELQKTLVAPADTLDSLDDWEDGMPVDTAGRSGKNYATEFNALDYVFESRYLNHGEHFTKRWDDHLFFEAGAGVMQMVPPISGYHFNPLTTADISVGKQFDKLHSLRLSVRGAFGYQQEKDVILNRVGMKLDWLFSLSSYIDGYNPSRLLDVSLVGGIGGHYTRYTKKRSGYAPEGHLGLQLRFFSGPQGYFAIEPYAGIAGDNIDLSENRNFRKADVFYGANLSFIYYLHNNLSPESRLRFLRRSYKTEKNDTVLPSWRVPWFMEFGSGVSFMNAPSLNMFETMGHDLSLSLGKWFSPVVGIRLTGSVRTVSWQKVINPEKITPYHPEYRLKSTSSYSSGRIEAMFNPMGFGDRFSWDEPYGFYFVAGGEIGWVHKNQSDNLRCRTMAYSGGIHLWAGLTEDIRFFVEPRYTYYEYKIPYNNVDWNKRFSDDVYSINFGLTVNMRARRFRENYADNMDVSDRPSRFYAGVGGGLSSFVTKTDYYNERLKIGFNGTLFCGYRINEIHGLRLSFEYMANKKNSMNWYNDYGMSFSDGNWLVVKRNGLWNHRFFWGFASLDYSVNLCSLISGYCPDRKFDVELYAGPTLVMLYGERGGLDESELLQAGHEARLIDESGPQTGLGGNLGLRVSTRLYRNISLFASPTVYVFKACKTPGTDFSLSKSVRLLETLNVGVQYDF